MSEAFRFSPLAARDSNFFKVGGHFRHYGKPGAGIVNTGETIGPYFAVRPRLSVSLFSNNP